MDINTGINPQSFGFDRSFFEAGCKMGDEDRLRFYDSLCEVAFNRRMDGEGERRHRAGRLLHAKRASAERGGASLKPVGHVRGRAYR